MAVLPSDETMRRPLMAATVSSPLLVGGPPLEVLVVTGLPLGLAGGELLPAGGELLLEGGDAGVGRVLRPAVGEESLALEQLELGRVELSAAGGQLRVGRVELGCRVGQFGLVGVELCLCRKGIHDSVDLVEVGPPIEGVGQAAFWVSVKAPSRECTTTVPKPPATSGIWVAAWSSTFWKVLPGMVTSGVGEVPKVAAPPPRAASTISQAAMTVLTWSAHQRPTR